MSSQEDNEIFEDTSAQPINSVTFLPSATQSNLQLNKKRKLNETSSYTISESNQAKFKVLKKFHIQRTRTNHHIKYLRKCVENRMIPKALRVNIIPQVPVISSALQLQWEEAQLNFGYSLTNILLDYWEIRNKNINKEIDSIQQLIKTSMENEEYDFMISIIDKISLNVEYELANKNKPTNNTNKPSTNK